MKLSIEMMPLCCAISAYFLMPPLWRHVVAKTSEQLVSRELPLEGFDAPMREDVTPSPSILQVRTKKKERTSLQMEELHGITAAQRPLDQFFRPNLGGKPDVVEFAIYVKNFFGLQFRHNLFSLDVVLTLRWMDNRTTKLLPAGATHAVISVDEARKTIWLPDVMVANRAIGGQEEISSALDLNRDGTVIKTQRLKLSIQQHFDVAAFPFDYQTPRIILSSTTLMTSDLVLKKLPDKKLHGAKPGLFNDREFQYVSEKTTVFEEVDASLHKSRGKLAITLKRDWTRYLQTTILPEVFLILISFTVFWMPRATPFAMPRVATNLISFLTLMTLSINTAEMLPPDRAGMAWIELFADSMQMQNCLILFLNVFVDWVYNTLDLKELGEKMTNELAGLFPLMGSVVVLMCFAGRSGENLARIQWLIRIWMFGVQSTWIYYSIRRVREAEKAKAQ
jgi:hypothetical protein